MAYYTVKYTDENNKTPITVNDSTVNTDTPLTIPGRNQRGYAISIAENFLHLLENFAYSSAPDNPVEGQLWYDTTSGVEDLKVYDGTGWKLVGGIRKSTSEPTIRVTGDLWVDTDNQQLFLFNGASWVLVGPTFSSGLRTGVVAETIVDSDDIDRTVLKTYISDEVVFIYSVDSFIPKVAIAGFTSIKSGVNISTKDFNSDGTIDTKYWGTAEKAENLIVGSSVVASSNFLRKDTSNITNYGFTVRNDVGISTGNESQLRLSVDSGTIGNIYHATPDSAFDIRVTYGNNATTLLRADSNGNIGIGINNLAPAYSLDVLGTGRYTGVVKIDSTDNTINDVTGALQVAGGVNIQKDLIVRGDVAITGQVTVGEVGNSTGIVPLQNNTFTIGTSTNKFSKIYSTEFYGTKFTGAFSGDIDGTANLANRLTAGTTFRMIGDVSAVEDFTFDGSTGGTLKIFDTRISELFIDNQTETFGVSASDNLIVYRTGTGLRKMSRNTFFQQVATVPVGSVLPWAGTPDKLPAGYLFCDGSEKPRSLYPELFAIIGYTYGDPSQLSGVATFRLPDLRGRFPLGSNNMDNGDQVISQSTSSLIDSNTQVATGTTQSTASILGNANGYEEVTLELYNIPDHKHDFMDDYNNSFYAIRNDSAAPEDPNATSDYGLTSTTQAQIINRTGNMFGASDPTTPFNVMNPYLTINYIIYSGKYD